MNPLLAGLRRAGTRHIYADTAAAAELDPRWLDGVDGNTANQPLVRKALAAIDPAALPAWLDAAAPEGTDAPALYAAACARLARAFAGRAAGAAWDTSIQLHMDLCADPARARAVARGLARAVPGALVKVPFAPHLPQTLLLARDLEAEGIRVNLTSTFSARQVVAAAVLCRVARTNVFMGRLNQGLGAALLGEHVCLEAQRALLKLRRGEGVPTQLIVASMRDWRTFVSLAGCDAFTAPVAVLDGFLQQGEVAAGDIASRLEASYADRLGISDAAVDALGRERIARLYRIEPEFIDFLWQLRSARDFAALGDGDELYGRFAQAGFGDFFHAPGAQDWQELRRDKLVPPAGALALRIALDTHYTLRAHADFEQHQHAIDALLGAPAERLRTPRRRAP